MAADEDDDTYLSVIGPTDDRRPHSRACGPRPHVHGPYCARDCPTCQEPAEPGARTTVVTVALPLDTVRLFATQNPQEWAWAPAVQTVISACRQVVES